jgi:hypothetical protein
MTVAASRRERTAAPRSDLRALFSGPPLWAALIWLLLVLGGLVARPSLVAVDGALLSDAWWSWQGTTAGPQAGPELLFWLIHAGWYLFGVSEFWARLVAPLFVLAGLWLAFAAARALWPQQPDAARFAPLTLIGTGGLVAFASQTLTDTPMIAVVLLALFALGRILAGRALAGSALFALALLAGLLLKGPLALVHLLPAALLLAWTASGGAAGRGRYAALAAAALAACTIWAGWIAVRHGGAAFVDLLLPEPASNRRSWYWLPLFALLFAYPWIWWRTAWRAFGRLARAPLDDGCRLLLVATAAAFLGGFLTPYGGQHVLVPGLALASLLLARALGATPEKARDFHAVLPGMALLFVGFVFFLLNIVPHAHLDALWRRLMGESSLPIWLGGISLAAGLLLLGGGYLLAQLTPRPLSLRVLQVALLPVLMATALNLEFIAGLRDFFDLRPFAERIHALQTEGHPIAVIGQYDGGFDLAGRLIERPIELADANTAHRWAAANGSGVVIAFFAGSTLRLPARPLDLAAAGDRWAALWPAATIIATEGAVLRDRF